HLCGFCFGSGPKPAATESRRSWTQIEYLRARELGKPVFVGLAEETAYRPKCPPQPPEDGELQAQYYERFRTGLGLYYPFTSISDIKHAITVFLISMQGGQQAQKADHSKALRQLPSPTAHFTNRTKELRRLSDAVKAGISHLDGGAPCVVGLRGLP